MRGPLERHAGSPALRFLREGLTDLFAAAVARRWSERLAAGGIVREIERTVAFRRTLPLVESWIRAVSALADMPADERATLVASRLDGEACAKAVAATVAALGEACRAEGVSPILLKGTALHGALYRNPALRPVSDVDLWVPPRDLPAVRRALDRARFAPDRITAGRLSAFDASGGRECVLSDFVFRAGPETIPVEVKLDPVQIGVPLKAAERYADGATPSAAYDGFRVLAPGPMAVQQALHLARHDGSDLLWFAELALGLRRAAGGGIDLHAMRDLVASDVLAGPLRAALEATQRVFPGSVPAGLLVPFPDSGPTPARLLKTSVCRGDPVEREATLSLAVLQACASGRLATVVGSLGRRIWPHHDYVAARMNLPPGSRVGVAARARRLAAIASLPLHAMRRNPG